jgi:hypothetical protein
MFLNGNFVALPAFQKKYGVHIKGSNYAIPTKWQSALLSLTALATAGLQSWPWS